MRALVALAAGILAWTVMYALAALIWYNFVNIFWLSYDRAVIGGMFVGAVIGVAGFVTGVGVFVILSRK